MQDTFKLGRLVGVKVGANWSLFALAGIVGILPGHVPVARRCARLQQQRLLVGRHPYGRGLIGRCARPRGGPRRCRPALGPAR